MVVWWHAEAAEGVAVAGVAVAARAQARAHGPSGHPPILRAVFLVFPTAFALR